MNQKANASKGRAASGTKKLCDKQTCNLPEGVKIIGELGAKFWLLQTNANQEGKDAKGVYSNDNDGASVP